jgi:hypothetical protein
LREKQQKSWSALPVATLEVKALGMALLEAVDQPAQFSIEGLLTHPQIHAAPSSANKFLPCTSQFFSLKSAGGGRSKPRCFAARLDMCITCM